MYSRHTPITHERQQSRIMHKRNTASQFRMQPEDQDARVRQEREVTQEGGKDLLVRLSPLGNDVVVPATQLVITEQRGSAKLLTS